MSNCADRVFKSLNYKTFAYTEQNISSQMISLERALQMKLQHER